MSGLSPSPARVSPHLLLDARLALFHERERWLALADLHFGFELSQRNAGRLVPFWGMESSRTRLEHLLEDYRPDRLIIIGDLVHDAAAVGPLCRLLAEIEKRCEVVAIAGNHDRGLRRHLALVDSYTSGDFEFHHGHCETPADERIHIIGHFHPAAALRDGAGLHLKFPAFVREERCWILPAFSPWSSGTIWEADEQTRVWICSPRRVFPLDVREPAA